MIRWWPPVAVLAMVIVGVVVGKQSTPLDDWFFQFGHTPARWLLLFSQPALVIVVMMAAAAVAYDRGRQRLALRVLLAPVVAWGLVQLLKRLFGRLRDGYYAYPSGHITLTVVVWGMFMLVFGMALWSVYTSIAVVALAVIGQGTTHHYFTDTIGGLLLGSAVVGVAALLRRRRRRKLTHVNPVRSASHKVVNMSP